MKRIVTAILSLAMIIPALIITAQDVTDNEEITVVAPYQPSVSDAFKINVSPRIPAEELEKPEFSFDVLSKQPITKTNLEPITAARIRGESISKLYKNYIKAGFGNYTTPYFEFYANQLRSKKGALGVHVKHWSSSGKIKDYAYPGNSITRASVYGKKFFRNQTLSAVVDYDRQGVHYYGYKPDHFPEIDLSKKEIKQVFNKFNGEIGLASNHTREGRINYDVNLGYYYLMDKFESTEHNIRFDGGLSGNPEFFDFSDREKLGITTGVDYSINSDTVADYSSGTITIKPFYQLGFDQYKFEAGINTVIESDSTSYVHFYPEVKVEVKVVEDHLITYAGIRGDLERSSLDGFRQENPFVITDIEKRFVEFKSQQFGGLKGSIANFLDYNLSFTNSTIGNMPLFVNDTNSALGEGLNNQFTVVYDDVKYTKVLAEFGIHLKDNFNLHLKGQYNNYFLDNEDEAWHRPALEFSVGADYVMQEKILLRAGLFSRSKMYAKTYTTDDAGEVVVAAEELDPMIDLNLGIEYRYSKALSGFLNLNNILGQRYYHWYNYPSYRFNLLLGVAYSF